jgi:hypothetical protein
MLCVFVRRFIGDQGIRKWCKVDKKYEQNRYNWFLLVLKLVHSFEKTFIWKRNIFTDSSRLWEVQPEHSREAHMLQAGPKYNPTTGEVSISTIEAETWTNK